MKGTYGDYRLCQEMKIFKYFAPDSTCLTTPWQSWNHENSRRSEMKKMPLILTMKIQTKKPEKFRFQTRLKWMNELLCCRVWIHKTVISNRTSDILFWHFVWYCINVDSEKALLFHHAGRRLTSDWLVHCFILIVYKKKNLVILWKVNQGWDLKNSHRQPS